MPEGTPSPESSSDHFATDDVDGQRTVTYAGSSSDNVDGGGSNAMYSHASDSHLFPIGTTVVTYNVTDTAGNIAACRFSVTITDTDAPTISCPANKDSEVMDDGQNYATVTFPNPTTLSDNSNEAPRLSVSPIASGEQFPSGTTTVTFTAVDGSGNANNCSFDVTVVDNQDPSVICPGNIATGMDAGESFATVAWVATASDNADGENTVVKVGTAGGASDNTTGVALESHLIGLDSNRDWSLHKGSLKLISRLLNILEANNLTNSL